MFIHALILPYLRPRCIPSVRYCLKFNPYLDADYQIYLQHQRDVQKSSGKYKAVWTRQSGKCYYCGYPMLADQRVEVIEKNIGEGRRVDNLIYIHSQCAYDIFSSADVPIGDHIDLFSMLDGIMDDAPLEKSPYLELTDFFHQCKRPTVSLRFSEIEAILGDELPWEAYCFDAFWYDDDMEQISSMWQEEEFPFHTFQFSERNYSIVTSWTSQGYSIKALHREECRVVFRMTDDKKTAGVILPKALMQQRLPEELAYQFKRMADQFVRDHGL